MTDVQAHLNRFKEKIESRDALIAVIGMGYVGLPISLSFAEAGFSVLGIDLSPDRVESIKAGRSFLHEVDDERISDLRRKKRLDATRSYQPVKEADAVLICVPTPITEGSPDLSHVLGAGKSLAKVLKPGALVVLESTTYPGTTQDLLKPLLEAGGSIAGRDFFLAYSPERIDPGNPTWSFSDIPKVVGGVDTLSAEAATTLYAQVVPKVFTVSGTREAEMAKLVENTFRHVNIALINELAVYAHEMDVDIWEVIEAAATKPFGFMPFYPGPGWGGHCIPLDPSYLSWLVRRDRAHEVRFVELAHAMNAEMPRYVVERATLLLNEQGKAVSGAKILCVGVSYKPGTEDTRGAGALKVLTTLAKRGADVSYHDPLVAETPVHGRKMQSVPLSREALRDLDLVVILVNQVGVEWSLVREEAPLVLDCANAVGTVSGRIRRL